MAAESVVSVFSPCLQNCVECIYLKIKNQFKIRSNCKDLKQNMKSLVLYKSFLLNEEAQRHLPNIQVKIWFDRVARLEEATCPVLENGGAVGCMRSLNCKLSNDILIWLGEAKQLIVEAKEFDTQVAGVYRAPKAVEYIPTAASIKGQPVTSRLLGQIMDLLKDDSCTRIGIYGMGGVGKSTLMQNLNNELEKSKYNLFTTVIYVTVSRQQSSTPYAIQTIQKKIAKRLCVMIEEGDCEESVASRLYATLKEEHFLLILDDLWAQVDLNKVGIPQVENSIGSKIILTSRSLEVCNRMRTDLNLKVEPLSGEEAWELFAEKVVKEVVNDEKIKPLAQDVVKECNGLPLALAVVGASMRKKSHIALWEYALDQLQRSKPLNIDVEEEVFKPLKWSYDCLESTQDEPLKSCFLFFCLFPEDHEVYIPDLVHYWLAEGLLDEHADYEQRRRRCYYIVERLKDSCLLESINQNYVRMHDVVRDVGIWIATLEDEFKSIICAGSDKTELSIQKQLSNCSSGVKRVSLIDIQRLPNCEVQCPQTSTLFLQFIPQLHKVPYLFLKGFQTLRILDLSGSEIKSLPHSLVYLGDLQALILYNCERLSELPPLAALGRLQVLNCSYTNISRLPEGFENLRNLRQLDLSYTRKLKSIPAEKISKLCSLECLKMRGSATKCGFGKGNEDEMHFEELLHLNHIRALHINLKGIPNVSIKYDSWFKRLKSVEVRVYFDGLHFSRDECVGWMLNDAVECRIDECKGVGLMLDRQVRNNACFINLGMLVLSNCCISFKTSPLAHRVAKCDMMPNLNELHFSKLSGLESLSDFTKFLGLRFTKLSVMYVKCCDELDHVLAIDDGIFLMELKDVCIVECKKLTQVFKNTSSRSFAPNLGYLTLDTLPELVKIFKADDDVSLCKTLKVLEVKECDNLRKLPFGTQNGQCIPGIEGEQEWWDKLEWDTQDSKMHVQSYFTPKDGNNHGISANVSSSDDPSDSEICYDDENDEAAL